MDTLRGNAKAVKSAFVSFPVDFVKHFSVLELPTCYYVETRSTDDEGITTVELYYIRAKDSHLATLISRFREGEEHVEMRSYDRDNKFPLYCQVRIQ